MLTRLHPNLARGVTKAAPAGYLAISLTVMALRHVEPPALIALVESEADLLGSGLVAQLVLPNRTTES